MMAEASSIHIVMQLWQVTQTSFKVMIHLSCHSNISLYLVLYVKLELVSSIKALIGLQTE